MIATLLFVNTLLSPLSFTADPPLNRISAILIGSNHRLPGDDNVKFMSNFLKQGAGNTVAPMVHSHILDESTDADWIVKQIENAQVNEGTCLVVYLAVHGVIAPGSDHPRLGSHFFDLDCEKNGRLPRKRVLDAMLKHKGGKPGLAILITDSCACKDIPYPQAAAAGLAVKPNVFKKLFLEQRGVVDINAAGGLLDGKEAGKAFAWHIAGGTNRGGLFTRAFTETIGDWKGMEVSWPVVIEAAKKRTNDVYMNQRQVAMNKAQIKKDFALVNDLKTCEHQMPIVLTGDSNLGLKVDK